MARRTYRRDKIGRFAGTGSSKNTALGRKVQSSTARAVTKSGKRFDTMRKKPGESKASMAARRGTEMAKGAAARSSLARMSARTGGATGRAFRAVDKPGQYKARAARIKATKKLASR